MRSDWNTVGSIDQLEIHESWKVIFSFKCINYFIKSLNWLIRSIGARAWTETRQKILPMQIRFAFIVARQAEYLTVLVFCHFLVVRLPIDWMSSVCGFSYKAEMHRVAWFLHKLATDIVEARSDIDFSFLGNI